MNLGSENQRRAVRSKTGNGFRAFGRLNKRLYVPMFVLLMLFLLSVTPSASGTTQSGVVAAQAVLGTATPLPATGQPPNVTAIPTNATSSLATPNVAIHVVQRGENLFRLAQQYGTTVQAIAQANGISDVTVINAGQRLLIPNPSTTLPGIPTQYVVQPTDSLFDLSFRYGTSITAIAQQNNIVDPRQLYVGLKLNLQEGGSGQSGIKTGWVYTVQPGDNLFRIATQYGVSFATLAKINNLVTPPVLFTGQRLVIPGPPDGQPLADSVPPFAQVKLLTTDVEQGRTFSLNITTTIRAALSGTFLGKPLLIHSDATQTHHTLIDGIDSLTTPGIYPLELLAMPVTPNATPYKFTRNIEVADGGYISESIVLDPSLADLINPKITVPEANQVFGIVGKVTDKLYLSGPLGLPCPAPITSQFGTRRSYNGGPFDQVHTGTDFAAPPSAPIYAPAAGIVVFTGPLTVRGNATIIDHGWGIYTGYWHQTEIKVKVGDVIQQGQLLGTVGNTGRVTGPHLHWELFINGIQVDPLQWVRQNFF